MPNKEEAIKMRLKAIKEVSLEIEKAEEFLRVSAGGFYRNVITPEIENQIKNHLFSDIAVDFRVNTLTFELVDELFRVMQPISLKIINHNNIAAYLRDVEDLICSVSPEEGNPYFFRPSYLKEFVEKDGYSLEPPEDFNGYVVLATIPKLERDKNGKVLIKK